MFIGAYVTIGNPGSYIWLAYIFEATYSTVLTSVTKIIKYQPIRIREIGDVTLSDVLYASYVCIHVLSKLRNMIGWPIFSRNMIGWPIHRVITNYASLSYCLNESTQLTFTCSKQKHQNDFNLAFLLITLNIFHTFF